MDITDEEATIVRRWREKYTQSKMLKICIATPCFGGQVFCGFMRSVLSLQQVLTTCEIEFDYIFLEGESLIPRARNSCVEKFMSSDCSHLLFIDADITFRPKTILNLLCSELEMCGTPYPKKHINWAKVKDILKKEPEINSMALRQRISDINWNPLLKKIDGDICMSENKGFVEVKDIPTGMMLIRRSVIQSLMAYYPELKYVNNVAGYGNSDYFYDFFRCGIDDGTYLSEDYYFCKLCREAGIKLYLDLQSTLIHTGKMDFYGCLGLTYKNFDTLNEDVMLKKTI